MSKYYFELIIKTKNNYTLFLNLLNSLSHEAIEEKSDELIIRSQEDLTNIEFGVLSFAKKLNLDCKTILNKKDNINWIKQYQKSVRAIEIGSYFIRPSWCEKKENKIDIIIDPALSFGSGHHESTSSCIMAIDEFVKNGNKVLDVGTGSGILAIASLKKKSIVDICDTDELCIKDALKNLSLNNVKCNKYWIGSAKETNEQYDIVIANIVADVLIIINKELKNRLKSNGILILSGILDKYLEKVLEKFKDLTQVKLIRKNEWISLVFIKN